MSDPHPHGLLDETIHQKTRLAIMATLAPVGTLAFAELRATLGVTDGNLSSHLSALERAGYVRITKRFLAKKPHTSVAMTASGKREMERYLGLLEAVLARSRSSRSPRAESTR